MPNHPGNNPVGGVQSAQPRYQTIAGWRSLAAHGRHKPLVAGSNPAPATFNAHSFNGRTRVFGTRYRGSNP